MEKAIYERNNKLEKERIKKEKEARRAKIKKENEERKAEIKKENEERKAKLKKENEERKAELLEEKKQKSTQDKIINAIKHHEVSIIKDYDTYIDIGILFSIKWGKSKQTYLYDLENKYKPVKKIYNPKIPNNHEKSTKTQEYNYKYQEIYPTFKLPKNGYYYKTLESIAEDELFKVVDKVVKTHEWFIIINNKEEMYNYLENDILNYIKNPYSDYNELNKKYKYKLFWCFFPPIREKLENNGFYFKFKQTQLHYPLKNYPYWYKSNENGKQEGKMKDYMDRYIFILEPDIEKIEKYIEANPQKKQTFDLPSYEESMETKERPPSYFSIFNKNNLKTKKNNKTKLLTFKK